MRGAGGGRPSAASTSFLGRRSRPHAHLLAGAPPACARLRYRPLPPCSRADEPRSWSICSRDRALSCSFGFDLRRLEIAVELDLGACRAPQRDRRSRRRAGLDRLLAGDVLDPADRICRTGDGDGYLVFLAPRQGARVELRGALGQGRVRDRGPALAPIDARVGASSRGSPSARRAQARKLAPRP